jgi:hypothetical protein
MQYTIRMLPPKQEMWDKMIERICDMNKCKLYEIMASNVFIHIAVQFLYVKETRKKLL